MATPSSSFSFPTLNPLLGGLPSNAAAPPSPSSTSVSSASGPDDLDDSPLFLPGPGTGVIVNKGNWKGKGNVQHGRKGSSGEGEDGMADIGDDGSEEWEVRALGVGGDKLPYEIWLHVLKLLPSTTDLHSCLLVSHLWCQIGVEILWHKPALHRLTTLYRVLNVIDPIPVQSETVGSYKARKLLEEGRRRSSSRLDGSSSTDGISTGPNSPSSRSSSVSPAPVPASIPPSGGKSSKSSSNKLPWDYPTFLIDDPSLLANTASPPTRTFPYASFIRRLNFSLISDHITDHSFYRLRHCSRLERLTLQGCSKLSDSTLSAVLGGGNMPELVALDLTNVKGVTDETVVSLAKGCPRLQGLNLSGCRLVSDAGILAVAQHCRLLRRIKLVKCDLITDISIIALARLCPLLLEVDLVDVPKITSSSCRELWLFSSHLREFRLSSCSLLDDEGFPFLFPRNNGNIHPPSYTPLRLISSSIVDQTDTRSRSDDQEPDETQQMPVPPPNWQRNFDHLRTLDLTSCSLITDEAVEAIVSNAPKIRSLILAKCTGLSDASLASICGLGRSLHQLHMGHVSKITDGAVAQLARTCTRLRYIDLACCPNLTDLAVFELSQLPKLRRIGLVRVTNLTDNAIHALVERPSSLERIHLSYCENISIEAVHFLLQRLNKLTHLSLTGVPAFRRPDLQRFCRQPPKDFNPHQRQAFCVYSGPGVSELRSYLLSIFDPSPDTMPSSPSSSAVSISFEHDQDGGSLSDPTSQTQYGVHQPNRGHQHQLRREGWTAPGPEAALTEADAHRLAATYRESLNPTGPSSHPSQWAIAYARQYSPLPGSPSPAPSTSSHQQRRLPVHPHADLPAPSPVNPNATSTTSSSTWAIPSSLQPFLPFGSSSNTNARTVSSSNPASESSSPSASPATSRRLPLLRGGSGSGEASGNAAGSGSGSSRQGSATEGGRTTRSGFFSWGAGGGDREGR